MSFKVDIKPGMKNLSHFKSFRSQKGFSMIELMIAGLLGLLLIGGVIQLFLSSNQNYRTSDELATLQEDGRLALMFLKDQIQRGSWTTDYLDIPDAIDFTRSSDGANDSVAVSFNAVVNGTSNLDCNGVAVADGKVVNQFYIDNNQLMCRGNGAGSTPQPLIAGVEDFQVLYGVESITSSPICQSGLVNNYLTAAQVLAGGLSKRIMSVRVGLLLASSTDVLPAAEARTHQLLDKAVATNDQLARRIFQQTVFMPNAVYATAGNPQSAIDCL